MIKPENEADALEVLKEKKIVTIQQLSDLLECSRRTTQRRLKEWQTYNSYNKYGKYFTLPNIPEFDRYGLWKYKGVFFSRYGNLENTITHLVKNSERGFDASGIGKMLGLLPRSFISHFQKVPGLIREKHENIFVYFSDEEDIYQRQKNKREEAAKEKDLQLPPDADAVLILADRIKNPKSSIEDSVRRLRRKGMSINPSAIYKLLDYHGIEKKTLDTHS
jgi:G3E family GTPase